MAPIHVRSIRMAESDNPADVRSPILSASAAENDVISAGTYLHRSDVIAVLEGYAAQMEGSETGCNAAIAIEMRTMAAYFAQRGV